MKLERSEDKDRILERYLNTVYFGRGAYGIEAAARAYFDVHASDLDAGQAALLVGLLRSPESADPVEDMEEAEARRASVIGDMVDNDKLSQDEADAVLATPIDGHRPHRPHAAHAPGWRRTSWSGSASRSCAELGEDALYGRGLRVVTTLDLDAQRAAEAAVAEVITDPEGPQAALDRPRRGRRHPSPRRQPRLRDAEGRPRPRRRRRRVGPPARLHVQAVRAPGRPRGRRDPRRSLPRPAADRGGRRRHPVPRRELRRHRVRRAHRGRRHQAARSTPCTRSSSPGSARRRSPTPPTPRASTPSSTRCRRSRSAWRRSARTTWPAPTSPTPTTAPRCEPYAIARIEDGDGNVLWEPDRPEPEEDAVDPDVARAVTEALRGVIESGTGEAADIGRPAAGKTGTTQDNVDAWFAGYVPGYAAVVWVGHPEPTPMDGVTGGGLPAQIWQRYMSVAMEGREVEDFPEAAGGPAAPAGRAPPRRRRAPARRRPRRPTRPWTTGEHRRLRPPRVPGRAPPRRPSRHHHDRDRGDRRRRRGQSGDPPLDRDPRRASADEVDDLVGGGGAVVDDHAVAQGDAAVDPLDEGRVVGGDDEAAPSAWSSSRIVSSDGLAGGVEADERLVDEQQLEGPHQAERDRRALAQAAAEARRAGRRRGRGGRAGRAARRGRPRRRTRRAAPRRRRGARAPRGRRRAPGRRGGSSPRREPVRSRPARRARRSRRR